MPTASGTFEVTLAPQPSTFDGLGRLSIDKRFLGDLEGSSQGEMLSMGTDVEGSAGYVALERVTGSLEGRTGSFALQHFGTLARGEPSLIVQVVPDSGTGELVGLSGSMEIAVEPGRHDYRFDYELPASGG